MRTKHLIFNGSGWLFGLLFLVIGIINTIWGNDPLYGVFVVFCSLFYFPPLNKVVERETRLSVPLVFKILLGLFILWSALGVAELFNKIALMMHDIQLNI